MFRVFFFGFFRFLCERKKNILSPLLSQKGKTSFSVKFYFFFIPDLI